MFPAYPIFNVTYSFLHSIFTDTSRKPRKDEENGKGYYFANREQMHTDIDEGKYLEWGDFEDNYYGTKLDTVRNVIRSGKTCILDVNPTVSYQMTQPNVKMNASSSSLCHKFSNK